MSLSSEIRKFVVENYFEPARANGTEHIAVISGEVHSAMKLKSRMPAVCNALRSKKLEQLGSVRLMREIRRLGVKRDSSTNQFKFEILHTGLENGENKRLQKVEPVDEDRNVSDQKKNNYKILVVVPCGKRKIWKRNLKAGPTKAKDAYVGSPFKVNREYAEKFADEWVILSAKYGFIEPDFVIPEDYDVTFSDPSTNPISLEHLKEQAIQMTGFDKIVALGSAEYAEMVKRAFQETGIDVSTPTVGLNVIKAVGKVKDAIRRDQPLTHEAPDVYSQRGLWELENKLGIRFSNWALLIAAVTRRAYVKELRDTCPDTSREDNKRLEFLGDGVLELAVRRHLYDEFQDREEDLSEMCDKLVSDNNLSRIAEDIGIERHLFLSKGEESDEKGRPSILAGALEAVIGAIYLDQGLEKARHVVERLVINR